MDSELNIVKQNLILSTGTHRSNRVLSPVEVSEGFKKLKDSGMSSREISDIVLFKDISMISKFERLLLLSPKIQHLIDWGSSSSTISFSSAAELARLDKEKDQELLSEAILKNKLSKQEVIQIIQIKRRSSKPILKCIDEIIKLRPEIERKFVFIGAIVNEHLRSILDKLTQNERNKLLLNSLNNQFQQNIHWEGRLGKDRFTLVGDEQFSQKLQNLGNFEDAINQLLMKEYGGTHE